MDRSTVITLIAQENVQDDFGVWRSSPKKTDVFAQVDSVTRSEFFEGGRNGLNPEFRFTMFGPDYNGEKIVEYNGDRYAVYRTFVARTDVLELYVQREGGVNG